MTMMTCACGRPATVVADVSTDGGIYIRAPICSPSCAHVRQAMATVDVVLDEAEIVVAMQTRMCWCRLPRSPGRYVTWCPRHGEIDVVEGACS